MKDNFSNHSNLYKQYRPEYPAELFDWIFQQVSNFDTAWDCGTGNGQIAKVLSTKFKTVFATDISEQQLLNAELLPNIQYSKQPAELTNFSENSIDLITVGQAIHWFDFPRFYVEVNRVAKKNAFIAVVGYGKIYIDPETDKIIDTLYSNILGTYWDKERKYIEEDYVTIPFPFTEIKCSSYSNQYSWNMTQLIGYLETWSAVKHYQKEKNSNPVDQIKLELESIWKEGEFKKVKFPIISRMGRIG